MWLQSNQNTTYNTLLILFILFIVMIYTTEQKIVVAKNNYNLSLSYKKELANNNISDQLQLNYLIEKYRQAHKEKNLEAVLELYYNWQTVDKKIRKSVEANHKRYLDYKIINITVAKAPLAEYKEFLLEGIRYKTSLQVTKVLKVKFENTNNSTQEVTIPLGQKDKRYYFVTARPVNSK